jgi:hypothetical protein
VGFFGKILRISRIFKDLPINTRALRVANLSGWRKLNSYIYPMIGKYLSIILLVVAGSCVSKESATQEIANSPAGDTLSSGRDSTNDHLSNLDSTILISYASYFSATKEFGVILHYQAGSDNFVDADKLDSTTYSSESLVRKRLPIAEARKEFYLQGMDTVSFYNSKHIFITKAALTRVELIDEETSSYFAAIYKADKAIADETAIYYCVSSDFKGSFAPDFSSTEVNDAALNTRIIIALKLDASQNWVMYHVKVMPSGKILSSVSIDTQSFIVETSEQHVGIVKQVDNDYYFTTILPVPVLVNNHPVFLVSFSVPETDVYGDYLMAFNGKGHEAVEYNRLKLVHKN